MTPNFFLAAAIRAIPLGAFAQSSGTSAAQEIASIDNQYSSVAGVADAGLPSLVCFRTV
jgi:hypothetical protein